MSRTIKIGFTESSKAVTASVSIEGTDDNILEDVKALYKEAAAYSRLKSIEKLR